MAGLVFISYGHADQEFVLRLARDLEARGAQVWIDRGDLHPGVEWVRSIAAAIATCQAFLLVVSKDSMRSAYVAQELAQAAANQKTILPLIYQNTAIPAHLQQYQFIDFRRGGYTANLADLLAGLTRAGVSLADAPELSLEQQVARRQERLGAPLRVRWGQVFKRIPGWSFAWGVGWAIFWLVIPLVMAILESTDLTNLPVFPFGGFLGGMFGGLLAGTVTMLVLRHQAISIKWKHMRVSIRIWGLVGPLGVLIAGSLALFLFESVSTNVDCSGMAFGDCFSATLGQGLADVMLNMIGMLISIIFYASLAIFGTGLVAGWLAVRHIRRLEPGILGRQALWVILSWGMGAFAAALASIFVMSLFDS